MGEKYQGVLISDFYSAYNKLQALGKSVVWGIFWLKIKKIQEKNKLAPESIDGMFCQELKTVLKQTIGVWNEYHKGTKVFEDLVKEKERAISRMVELLSLPICLCVFARRQVKHKDTQRIRKRIIKFNQELFTFLDNPHASPTNNRAKAAIETICHYEKDNFRQPFRFGGFKPGSDDEYYSDRHLEWYRTIKYFTGFISKAFNFIYGIAKDKVAMN